SPQCNSAEYEYVTGALPRYGPYNSGPATDTGHHGRPLEVGHPGQRRRRAPRDRHLPDVAPLDVVLIRAEYDCRSVRAHRDVLDLEPSGRQQCGPTAVDRDGIEMRPAVFLPWEHDTVGGPADLILRDHFAEHAAGPRVGDPHLA